MQNIDRDPEVAFVLGGGGYLGGYQAGMLRALFERGIYPELVVGTSIGSVQGAMIAANPSPSVLDSIGSFWNDTITNGVMKIRVGGVLSNLVRLRPAMASQETLRTLLVKYFGANRRIEDLAVPYQAAAASIERATVRYFDSGPLIPAILASAAVPGLWPPVRIGDEHYIDGGVCESVPITRAISYGAKTIYVLRLRQREDPLKAPRWPWQLGGTVFEVSRRHRLGQVINMRPEGVKVHLIPTGEELLEPPDTGVHKSVQEQLDTINRRIERGYLSACEYLDADESSRRSAVVRAKARRRGDAAKQSYVDRPLSPFVSAKLHQHFQMFDLDGDGAISHEEYSSTADRVSEAFGHQLDTPMAEALRETYERYWGAMCEAAGIGTGDAMDNASFDRALSRLSADPLAYDANLLPVTAAVLSVADLDHDEVLNPGEIRKLLSALGVAPAEARKVSLRLDTNGDGVIGIDELDEAFRDYFTSDERNCVGNLLFGVSAAKELASV